MEFKLHELLNSALSFVNGLSKEDALQCDNACLTEIIRQFAVAPPILRPDLMVESGRILLLYKGPLEIPSDIAGVEYIDIANGVMNAGENIRRELKALGILQ